MIDRKSRDVVFAELRKAAFGNGSGFECENTLMSLSSDDGVIEALRRTFREIMDEHDKPLKFVFAEGTDLRDRLARWLLFLKSNDSYTWPSSKLPSGILDYYKSTAFDRMTGGDKRTINAITHFMQAGDYAYWPFASKSDYEQAKSSTPRLGLRLGTSA